MINITKLRVIPYESTYLKNDEMRLQMGVKIEDAFSVFAFWQAMSIGEIIKTYPLMMIKRVIFCFIDNNQFVLAGCFLPGASFTFIWLRHARITILSKNHYKLKLTY